MKITIQEFFGTLNIKYQRGAEFENHKKQEFINVPYNKSLPIIKALILHDVDKAEKQYSKI